MLYVLSRMFSPCQDQTALGIHCSKATTFLVALINGS